MTPTFGRIFPRMMYKTSQNVYYIILHSTYRKTTSGYTRINQMYAVKIYWPQYCDTKTSSSSKYVKTWKIPGFDRLSVLDTVNFPGRGSMHYSNFAGGLIITGGTRNYATHSKTLKTSGTFGFAVLIKLSDIDSNASTDDGWYFNSNSISSVIGYDKNNLDYSEAIISYTP